MSTPVNGAPMTYFDGIKDVSGRPLVPEAQALPSHLAKAYFYAQSGPTGPQTVGGSAAQQIFGSETFNPRSVYANHSTAMILKILGAPNQMVLERVIPDDAGPKATIRLWLDVLETTVPIYTRESDGSIRLDDDGHPVLSGQTTTGIKYKWVATKADVTGGVDSFGQATQSAGDQTNVQAGTQSVRYPIGDFRVPHFGSDGNNSALRLWAPTNTGINPMDARCLTDEKFYPIQIACLSRKDELSTPKLVSTTSGAQDLTVSLKPGALLRAIDSPMYLGDVFLNAYQTLNHPQNPPKWGPFGEVFLYQANIKTVLEKMYLAEAPHANQFSDFGTSVATGVVAQNLYMINPISAVSSQNVPYTAVQRVTTGSFVHLSNSSAILATGGSDGTMDDARFAALVSEKVAEYNNPNSPLLDTATNPENVMYDSGFPLQTKLDLLNFIAIRKDTNVGLATHTVGARELTTTEETSMAVALATRARLNPESTYHGTQTCRVFIMGRSGKLLNSQFTMDLPVLIDVAEKYAQYMGADDGKWKPGYSPNKNPRNIVSSMYDFNATFTPSSVRQNDWGVGLNWLQSYDQRRVFIPAMKTVYQDDTSVLTSVITMFACSSLQRVGEQIWRDYVGRDDLTKPQLRQEVEREVKERTKDKYDGRFVVEGEVIFTKEDNARGYSWHLDIHIYANNMMTVQVLSVVAHRMEELETSTS